MSDQTTTAVIEKVTEKEGATNGRPWRKFGVLADGTWFGTFDTALGDQAKTLEGKRAVITWRVNEKKPDLKDFLGATEANGAQPVTGEAREVIANTTPDGATDWDLIGLRKTRCALWAQFLSSPLAAHIAATQGEQPPSVRVFNFGSALVAMAESDIYHRNPAGPEEALPF